MATAGDGAPDVNTGSDRVAAEWPAGGATERIGGLVSTITVTVGYGAACRRGVREREREMRTLSNTMGL